MKAKLEDIVGTYVTNYSDELRKILNLKKEFLDTDFFLAWSNGELSKEFSDFIEELYSKIPTNKHVFCNLIVPKLKDSITELPDEEREQMLELLNKYSNVDSLKLIHRNVTKLMVANKNYVFTSDFIEGLIRKMYSLNKTAYAAEVITAEFFTSKGKQVRKASKKEDMFKGVDLYVGEQKIQVKCAKKIDIVGKNILISAYLDLSSYQKKSWTYIVFVERNILYLLSREDIDDIKYEVPNYNIYLKNIGVCKSYTIKMNVDTFKTEEEKEWEFK